MITNNIDIIDTNTLDVKRSLCQCIINNNHHHQCECTRVGFVKLSNSFILFLKILFFNSYPLQELVFSANINVQ